jgi:hypothetical protein
MHQHPPIQPFGAIREKRLISGVTGLQFRWHALSNVKGVDQLASVLMRFTAFR